MEKIGDALQAVDPKAKQKGVPLKEFMHKSGLDVMIQNVSEHFDDGE